MITNQLLPLIRSRLKLIKKDLIDNISGIDTYFGEQVR